MTDPSGVQNYEVHLEAVEVTPHIYPSQLSTAPALGLSLPCFEWYRWRVRATDGAGNTGAWSNESLFSVARFIITPTPTPDTDPPPVPTPEYPGNSDFEERHTWDVTAGCPTLSWRPVQDPSGVFYDVILDKGDSEDGRTEVDRWIRLSDPEVEASECELGESYGWSVRAEDGAGNISDWSKPLYYEIREFHGG